MSKHTRSRSHFAPSASDSQFRVRRGAKALVASSDRVLLVQERHANGDSFWTLPGGGVRPGESLATALRRELAEELDCRCVLGSRTADFWYAHSSRRHTVSAYAVVECSLVTEPSPVAAEGIVDCRWTRPASFPTTTLPQVRTVVEDALDP